MQFKRMSACGICAGLAWILISSCSTSRFDSHGWRITAQANKATLKIEHERLGVVLKDAALLLNTDRPTSTWSVTIEENGMTVRAEKPTPSTWTFSASDNGLSIRSSEPSGFIIGLAPACENRIPARTEDQDNGILYTSLGPVSANNIHCLFDRKSDTMIRFPDKCRMSRCEKDPALMDLEMQIPRTAEITLQPDYYIETLGLKYYQPKPERFETAPVAWSSWYCYYMGTTEQDLINEADALAEHLLPYGLEYIQLDACYTRGREANYLEWNKDAFPRGGQWIFNYIAGKGFKPALWVNVYGSNYARAECEDRYPENFYLRDRNGRLSSACCTADTTVVRLDYSNPDVIERHLRPMFRTLVDEWGVKYLKDAGWGTWIDYYDRNKANAFDSTRTGREIYREVQDALREIVGPDFYIGGCAMHEIGLGFGVFDGSRTGGDDRAVWMPERERGMSMQTFFHSLFGANYLHNVVWHCDPDAAMVRNPLTLEEGRTVTSTIALTGQLYMASDFMAKLPKRKIELYQKTIPTTPIVPIDLYPYRIERNRRDGVVWCCPVVKEFPRAVDLKVHAESGVYDVVALYNWGDEPTDRSLILTDDLGLDADQSYLAFDFWNQQLLGPFTDEINLSVPRHGTRVITIHPRREHPQLLATSRHITGTVSIMELKWNAGTSAIEGTSVIVPGTPYSVFIHVPETLSVSGVEADAEIMYHLQTDELLEVKFSGNGKNGNTDRIRWAVTFSTSR